MQLNMISALYAKKKTDKVIKDIINSDIDDIFEHHILKAISKGCYSVTCNYPKPCVIELLKELGYTVKDNLQNNTIEINWKNVEEKS